MHQLKPGLRLVGQLGSGVRVSGVKWSRCVHSQWTASIEAHYEPVSRCLCLSPNGQTTGSLYWWLIAGTGHIMLRLRP